eukprot:TRINITY_DN46761_c0_g1_i1.p1 TRINITY_DN46761_c0_g1~~TRINITY_DN46761_c0_g1_i1.p1  ORF type:complete len:905 (+),score=218.27 TRINITY_DN46761_c0_g1_i1:39-2717(+)
MGDRKFTESPVISEDGDGHHSLLGTIKRPSASIVQSGWSKLDLEEDLQGSDILQVGSAYRIIAVSCRLTIKVRKEYNAATRRYSWVIEEIPHELLYTALKHIHQDCDGFKVPYFHIGWIDTYIEPEDRHELSSVLINKYSCVPVYLEKEEVEGFYHGFCKGVLWPLLHYSLHTKNFANKFKHFGMYQRVNERFADAVLRIYRRGDVVWVHDYHLLLTPKKIRERIPTALIGFFMHSPFPTVELFRQLPVRKDLLEGMMSADVLGFNAYSYCNHHRAACEALLSIDTESRGLLAPDGRFVRTHISPAGINFAALERIITCPRIQERVMARRSESSLKDLKIVVGRSRKLDDSQGALLRLQAFEEFLKENKDWRGKVVLLEVIDQQASSADPQLQAMVQETVGNINGRYGELGRPPPVHLVQPKNSDCFSMEESCELYMLGHVLMVTPLRDGLSLASHEAVVCQGDFPRPDGTVWKGNKAPLLLSEFAGAATALGGSIIVNPHDVTQVAKDIFRALNMTEEERSEAHHHNFEYVSRNTATFWAQSCLTELTAVGTPSMRFSAELGNDSTTLNEIRSEYAISRKRLLLLDWDGCMIPCTTSRGSSMTDLTRDILFRLCDDPCNIVYIMTGRTRRDIEPLLMEFAGIGLICEHGSFIRPHKEERWVPLSRSNAWMSNIKELLHDYSERTPGSMTEVKEVSLTWHWRDADHDFAAWMEKDLMVQLHQRMASQPFSCFIGRRSVEIHHRNASKVAAIQWVLENKCRDIDFVFAFGDDKADEDVFELIHTTTVIRTESVDHFSAYERHSPDHRDPFSPSQFANRQFRRWTVKVGSANAKTHAYASVESQKDAPEILAAIVMKDKIRASLQLSSPSIDEARKRSANSVGHLFLSRELPEH